MKFKPKRAEANVQAEFYGECKKSRIQCYLEYRSYWNGLRLGRWDAVIVKNDLIVAIVEVKGKKKTERERADWYDSKKGKLYCSSGVPVFLLCGMDEVGKTIQAILEMGGL